MRLMIVCAVVLALIPAAAWADCMRDAIKARQMILASGPFHYESKRWSGDTEVKIYGLIEPFWARHIFITRNTSKGQVTQERISVSGQNWLKGDSGWFQPVGIHTVTGWELIPFQMNNYEGWGVHSAKCFGQVEVEGKSLVGYELVKTGISEKLFVDPSSGLTVRQEEALTPPPILQPVSFNTISTFRYDPSIKIEPPQVDANAPWPPAELWWPR
jgi:hypothetical protein